MIETLKPTPSQQTGPWCAEWTIADLIAAAQADEDALERPALPELTEPGPSDWSRTCDLALLAAETLRRNESRIAQLEADNGNLEVALGSKLHAVAARVHFVETLALRAEAARVVAEESATRAEARAALVEGWLTRIAHAARHELAAALPRSGRPQRSGPVFPTEIAPQYASEPPGKARLRTCLDQYNANKANDANGGLPWIQPGGGYYSACNNLLRG